jgi:hypothetical protein
MVNIGTIGKVIGKTKAGLTAAQKAKVAAKTTAFNAARVKVISKTGDRLKNLGSLAWKNKKMTTGVLVSAGLSVAVAEKIIDKFNKTDGTICTITSMTDDTGKVYILFTPLGDDKTIVKDYCPGCTITITADNAVPSMVSPTPYVIDAIVSTDDPELQITSSTDFSTEATSGQFTYHADIEALAACATAELGSEIGGFAGGALCASWTETTGIECKWVKIIVIALIVLVVLSLLMSLL